MSTGDLEKRIGEAVSFHRLAASAVPTRPEAAFEYIRAARDILALVWLDMEDSGEFPQVLVDRVVEIEFELVEGMAVLLRVHPDGTLEEWWAGRQ
jgi:hypothetical protein